MVRHNTDAELRAFLSRFYKYARDNKDKFEKYKSLAFPPEDKKEFACDAVIQENLIEVYKTLKPEKLWLECGAVVMANHLSNLDGVVDARERRRLDAEYMGEGVQQQEYDGSVTNRQQYIEYVKRLGLERFELPTARLLRGNTYHFLRHDGKNVLLRNGLICLTLEMVYPILFYAIEGKKLKKGAIVEYFKKYLYLPHVQLFKCIYVDKGTGSLRKAQLDNLTVQYNEKITELNHEYVQNVRSVCESPMPPLQSPIQSLERAIQMATSLDDKAIEIARKQLDKWKEISIISTTVSGLRDLISNSFNSDSQNECLRDDIALVQIERGGSWHPWFTCWFDQNDAIEADPDEEDEDGEDLWDPNKNENWILSFCKSLQLSEMIMIGFNTMAVLEDNSLHLAGMKICAFENLSGALQELTAIFMTTDPRFFDLSFSSDFETPTNSSTNDDHGGQQCNLNNTTLANLVSQSDFQVAFKCYFVTEDHQLKLRAGKADLYFENCCFGQKSKGKYLLDEGKSSSSTWTFEKRPPCLEALSRTVADGKVNGKIRLLGCTVKIRFKRSGKAMKKQPKIFSKRSMKQGGKKDALNSMLDCINICLKRKRALPSRLW